MFYRLEFDCSTSLKAGIRKIILVLAIALDIIGLLFLIDSLHANLWNLAFACVFLIVSLLLRLISVRLQYRYEYLFRKDEFSVTLFYSVGKKQILAINAYDGLEWVRIKEELFLSESKKSRCYGSDAPFTIYEIRLPDGACKRVCLDCYMFALLQTGGYLK